MPYFHQVYKAKDKIFFLAFPVPGTQIKNKEEHLD